MKNVFVQALITAMASTLILSACGTTPTALNRTFNTSDPLFLSQLAADGTPEFAFSEIQKKHVVKAINSPEKVE